MQRLSALVLALLAPFLLAWSPPSDAGNCQSGKLLYNKTNATVPTACSNSSCHGPGVNLHNIQNAAGNPGAIELALDGNGANAEMLALDLRNNLPLTSFDIDDLATYIFYASIPQACPAAAPFVTANPGSASFGNVNVGSTSAPQVITVSNTGTGNATGLGYANSDAVEFLVNKTCGASIAAGATCTITLSYKPAAVGAASATYTITGPGVNVSISLSGTGVGAAANVSASPTSASFGSINVGSTSAGVTITISNSGGVAAAGMTYPAPPTHFGKTSTCTATLNAGASCAIAFTFSPTAAGTFTPTYTITGTGINLSISLSGTGVAAAAANLQAAPPVLAFNNVTVGQTSAAIAVTVSNSGGAAATGIVLNNSNATEFVVSGNSCGTTLNAGASCALNVAYAPSGAGADSATLTISYAGGGAVSIQLSGTGVTGPPPPAGQLSLPVTVAMTDQTVGTASGPHSVTVTNVGAAAVTVGAITSSNATEFAVSGSTCTTVSANASCTFNITFQPSAAGARSAAIIIASNGTGSPQTIAVTGTGLSVGGPPPAATAVEYYHPAFDHYFITAIADEITKLDNGTFVGWVRTGKSFKIYTSAGAGLNAVCRFFSTAFTPKSSHFYTPLPAECTVVKSNPSWMFEAEVFFVAVPALDGSCPAGTSPVYRVYNNGQGAAPNHRYTTDLAVRNAMLAFGWIPEGYGPIGVIMCAPQ